MKNTFIGCCQALKFCEERDIYPTATISRSFANAPCLWCFAGACVTMLKAFFAEYFVIPNPVIPNEDGTCLIDYTGDDKDRLTVSGELNKLAANISIGRNMAGVHWRTDYTESAKLGACDRNWHSSRTKTGFQ